MARLSASFRRRQTATNGATAAAVFALNVATGIWFTPFLVGRIGPESYGIIMLAVAIVAYGSPLLQGLSSALVLKFASARAGRAYDEIQGLLDASARLTLRMAAILAVAVIALVLFGPQWLGLAPRFRGEASAVLLLTGAGFVVGMLGIPFGAILYSANRLDLINIAQGLQILVRVLGAVLLLEWISGSPLMVPIAALAGGVVVLVWAFLSSRSISPLRLTLAGLAKAERLRLGGTEAGVFGYSAAFAIMLGLELVVVNYMTDELGVGRYAAVIQVAILLRSAMLGVAGISGPRIFAHSAEGDPASACRSTAESIRLLGILSALPAGVAVATAPLILDVWLGTPFAGLAGVLRASMVGTVIVVAAIPLYTLEISAHRAVMPAIVRAASILFYLALAVILFKSTALGLTSVPIAFAVTAGVFEVGIMAPLAAVRQGVAWTRFVAAFGPVLVGGGLAWALTRLVLWAWRPESLSGLVVFCAIVAIAYLAFAIMLFGRAEVRELRALVRQRATGAAN